MDADEEPGLPGQLDEDGRPYFSPSNQSRPADAREQWEGFISHWEYRGHTDSVKDVCVTGEDSFGRMRFVSTDGKGAASWLELSDGDSEKLASRDHIVNALVFIPPLNVVAAASVSFSRVPQLLCSWLIPFGLSICLLRSPWWIGSTQPTLTLTTCPSPRRWYLVTSGSCCRNFRLCEIDCPEHAFAQPIHTLSVSCFLGRQPPRLRWQNP